MNIFSEVIGKTVLFASQKPTRAKKSNLALVGIAANWGYDPQLSPNVWRPGPLCNTMLLGTTRVSVLNGTSFHTTALAECRL